jgi:hypothetical protein
MKYDKVSRRSVIEPMGEEVDFGLCMWRIRMQGKRKAGNKLISTFVAMVVHFTEIEIAGIVLRDPVTAATNVLMAAAGFYAWWPVRNSPVNYLRSWARFLFLLSVSSTIGIIVHGFSYYTGEIGLLRIWLAMGLVQCLGVSFAQIATAQHYFKEHLRWIVPLVLVQFIALGSVFLVKQQYSAAKTQLAVGMLPVLFWNMIQWKKGNEAAKWVALSVLVSVLTAAVHGFKISINIHWCNFNDIAHVLVIVSLLLMRKAVVIMSAKR